MKKQKLLLFFLVTTAAITLLAFSPSLTIKKNTDLPWDSIPVSFARAKDHKGKNVVSRQGAITFSTGLDNDYYEVDSNNKTGYLYVETSLGAFMNDNVKRVPLNICIVIDRSGSMGGIKMGYAKKAAKSIVEQLKTEDIVSVVMYDNAIDSVQSPILAVDKESIFKKIDAITPRGGTNLWGGTEMGYDFVIKNYKAGFINRVLLISDGLANVGLTDPKLINLKVQHYKDQNGVTLSTFGVGLDYNERLMTDMAETGLGNYYFIDAPDQMAQLFTKELNGMMNVAAQDAELKITLPAGVRIIKSYPMKYAEEAGSIVIKLRDLFSEETKGNVFTFSIADRTSSVLKFTSQLSYTDVVDGTRKTISHENLLRPIRTVDAYLTHFNQPVVEQVILSRANENLEYAMAAADRGDYDISFSYVDANNAFLAKHAVYKKNSAELRRMDSVNTVYVTDIRRAMAGGADSIKRAQKKSREMNYFLRQKKQ